MRRNYPEYYAILTLFVIYVSRDTSCQNIPELLQEKTLENTNDSSAIASMKNANASCKNKKCLTSWMSIMGSIQTDLMNAQAIIVKADDLTESCEKAERQSINRYLMCAGSMLNRNHVLTSATCIHAATHIKHNIRGTLAVAISPLKPTMQIIRVTEYKIHKAHNTNPYAANHLTHNLAILKLACRIDMDNFYKIDLPKSPFVHTCGEENCIVAIYRKVGRIRWVMHQILAPNVPLPNRRRKETMIKDGKLQKILEYKSNETTNNDNYRSKRKLAEPPIFKSRYESRKKSDRSNDVFSNLSIISTTENSLFQGTAPIFDKTKNSSIIPTTSLNYDGYEDWVKPVGNKTVRSFVVRSSDGHRSCPQTGAAIMFNRTQSAVVAVPCDDRQPGTKWGYTDLFDNLDWIHELLGDWNNGSGPITGDIIGGDKSPDGTKSENEHGNFSSCSTCIFNFFIDFGCKDKSQCGNKSSSVSGKPSEIGQLGNPVGTSKVKGQGCSGSNTVGIEVGIGDGCGEKTIEKIEKKPDYRGNWVKSLNTQIADSGKPKNLPGTGRNDDIIKHEQPVTIDPLKTTIVKDQRGDKDKYLRKDNPRVSQNPRRIHERPASISRTYKTSKSDNNNNKNPERVANEIGLQNIEGDSSDWLAEVEKGLGMNSEVKRELVESRRSS